MTLREWKKSIKRTVSRFGGWKRPQWASRLVKKTAGLRFKFPDNAEMVSVLAVLTAVAGIIFMKKLNPLLGLGLITGSFLLFVFKDRIRLFTAGVLKRKRGKARKAPASTANKRERLPHASAWIGFVLIAAGLFFGVAAQSAIAASPHSPGWKEWGHFILAALFFLGGTHLCRPPKKPEPQPLPAWVEWSAFGLIMVLASFLRIYRLGEIPSGMFIDQGMEGWAALQIIHEKFRPIWEFDVFQNPALLLYQLAAWFVFIPHNQFTFYLFFALLSLATFPLVYWTFRQIAGPRVALLSIFILAVMRWNMNFSRNGFPTIQVPFYLFGTLAFLLYGVRSAKRWPFYISAVFFATGLYTYQSYKVVPLLLLIFAAYELATNRKGVVSKWKSLVFFSVIFLALAAPFIWHNFSLLKSGAASREGELLIFNRCQQQNSVAPLIHNITRTAAMFHWRGDSMPRHNLQDWRMLDDVTGVLFFFGIVGALVFIRRKPHFYGIVGLLIMTLPCVVSIDAAHANRMLATTPFIALLSALPLAALWNSFGVLFRKAGTVIFLVFLSGPLWVMTAQNFDVYFHQQAQHPSTWREYAPVETAIGKKILKSDGSCYFMLSPRFINYYTINFLGYGHMKDVFSLVLPDNIIPPTRDPSRGVLFALDSSRTGVLDMLKKYYPQGELETLSAPNKENDAFFYRVSAAELDKVRGLKARFDRPVEGSRERAVPEFPAGLPAGPYRVVLTGNIFIESTGNYQWEVKGDAAGEVRVGRSETVSGMQRLEKGYHPVTIELDVPAIKAPAVLIEQNYDNRTVLALPAGFFNTLPAPRGLLGRYYPKPDMKGEPKLEQWDPILNYTNGNDFSPKPPYFVHWKGTLLVDQPGRYELYLTTLEKVGLKIDGEEWNAMGPGGKRSGWLDQGSHRLDIYYWKPDIYWPSLTFSWVKPDKTKEVVPNSAFGEVP